MVNEKATILGLQSNPPAKSIEILTHGIERETWIYSQVHDYLNIEMTGSQ
jgi:hypothetical protein